MRVVDREKQIDWQRYIVGGEHFAIGAGGDLRVNGQAREAGVHLIPDEDNDKEEGLREAVHHQQEN